MYAVTKRATDFVLALVSLIVLSPTFLSISIAIKLDSQGPVLFKQRRFGIHKTHFQMLKFRTMSIATPADTATHLLTDADQYITRIGRFLRRTSLDELPQVLHVLAGTMSVVGPRPALWNQYDLIAERDKYGANDVRPGITGLAQINGRDELLVDAKARLDGEYVQMMSPWMDARCIFWTLVKVLARDGVVEGGAATPEHPSVADPKTPAGER